MPQTARAKSEEYWRPADPLTARIVRPILAEGLCPDCGVRYPSGARFCYMCGGERNRRPVLAPKPLGFPDSVKAFLRQRFHLPVPSLVFFSLGIVCTVIGGGLGMFYQAATLAEWQAIQTWRVEWLLGAAAAMLAGVMFKDR